jgi:putative flippase GtrA
MVVGGIGFCVDGGLLLILNSLFQMDPLLARTIGFPTAVTVTWILNRNWTFSETAKAISHKRYWLYLSVQAIGAALNFGVFASLVLVAAIFEHYPILALAIGAAVSLVFTFTVSKHSIFAPKA